MRVGFAGGERIASETRGAMLTGAMEDLVPRLDQRIATAVSDVANTIQQLRPDRG